MLQCWIISWLTYGSINLPVCVLRVWKLDWNKRIPLKGIYSPIPHSPKKGSWKSESEWRKRFCASPGPRISVAGAPRHEQCNGFPEVSEAEGRPVTMVLHTLSLVCLPSHTSPLSCHSKGKILLEKKKKPWGSWHFFVFFKSLSPDCFYYKDSWLFAD